MVRALTFLLLTGALIAGLARLTLVRLWQVPRDDPELTTSLAPTLWPGDWVLLWRGTEPAQGNLVWCRDPESDDAPVVARLVGLPGDRVAVSGEGALRVNGALARTTQACPLPQLQVARPRGGRPMQLRCSVERFAGVRHLRAAGSGSGLRPLGSQSEVPPGRWFLLSDNRDAPLDSRELGPVPAESCRETVRLRLRSGAIPEGLGLGFGWIH